MAARTSRFGTVGAFRAVFADEDLRRVELAYLLFAMAKWGTRVAILVVAYEHGGAAETGLVAAIQLLLALERVDFLEAITKTPLSRMAADHTARERLPRE